MNKYFKNCSVILVLCFLVFSLSATAYATGQEEITMISIDPTIHTDYGLAYPITYEFKYTTDNTDLKVYKKYKQEDGWSQIATKTANDFFNGIEAVRFDYSARKAYVSVAFSADSDQILFKFTDSLGNSVPMLYNGVCKYYDNRKAVVTASADDWHDRCNYSFVKTCEAFRNSNIWLTVGIITKSAEDIYLTTDNQSDPNSSWPNIRNEVSKGYIEAASHSSTHPIKTPYNNVELEVKESKETIISKLDLPSMFRKGSKEYVYTWIEPAGECDQDIRDSLKQNMYLVDRNTLYGDISQARDQGNLYKAVPISIVLDFYNDALELNNKFDAVYNIGGIYHLMFHPWATNIDWEDTNNILNQHLGHIKDKKDVWYTSLGHLYLYNLVREKLDVKYLASTEFSAIQGQNGWYYMEKDSSGYINMTWDAVDNCWKGSSGWERVYSNFQHPNNNASVRKWVASFNGTIIIASNGNIRKANYGGDGVTVRLFKGNYKLWEADISGTDATGISFPQTILEVKANEEIYFELHKGKDDSYNSAYDATYWDPVIKYTMWQR